MIDTVPLPEYPVDINFEIPRELIKEFRSELRVVVRFPWIVGIPAPDYLFKNPEIFGGLEKFEVMIVPKMMR